MTFFRVKQRHGDELLITILTKEDVASLQKGVISYAWLTESDKPDRVIIATMLELEGTPPLSQLEQIMHSLEIDPKLLAEGFAPPTPKTSAREP